MAKESFNFGANRKPKQPRAATGKGKQSGKGKSNSGKSNAWRSYIGNAPLPD